MVDRVAIVGASAAGLAVAETLREEGFGGAITMVGAEQRAFYDRPPLSKEDISSDNAKLSLRPGGHDDLDIDLRLGVAATGLDLGNRRLTLSDATAVDYNALVIATGVDAINLPGGRSLRTLDEAVGIAAALDMARSVVVIGAGVLGGELAALAATKGRSVVLLDALLAPMIDRVGSVVGARLASLHKSHGVEAHYGVYVAGIADRAAGGKSVSLSDGRMFDADLVLVAIGARPAVSWLRGSGVPLDNGVVCDAYCRTVPDVYAAGDVANWFNPRFGRQMRIEHRMNATEQGMAVAANILGREEEFSPIPYFWTDLYDVKIQVHGMIGASLDTHTVAGDPEAGNFVLAYCRDGIVEGVLGWNMPGETRRARGLIGNPRP